MKNQLLFFGRYALLWLLFYMVTKGLFLLYQFDFASTLSFLEIIKVFAYGLRMDISATGYMLLLVGLTLAFSPFISHKWEKSIHKAVFIILGLFTTFITVLDFELYKHWGFRLDLTPLNYLGKDTTSSIEWTTLILLIGFWLLLFFIFYLFYIKWVAKKYKKSINKKWWHSIVYVFITTSLILPIRGSLDIGPMNLGFVYFHKEKPFANHAAINVFWNLGNAIYKTADVTHYPENMVSKSSVEADFELLYPKNNKIDTVNVLKTARPNILLIILEGITSKILAQQGGDPGIMPHLNSLAEKGVFFTNFYASGDRTDKGIISILSGFPSQPKTSIMKYASKSEKLPNMTADLKKAGYHTSYVYGGDVNFANMNAYLQMSSFDEVLNKSHFDNEQSTSKWGVHDHIVFDTLFHHLNRQELPFFTTALTLSSHEPYDVPLHSRFRGDSEESLYLNSAHYTDKSLGEFIKKARNTNWWDETLIIITADHGNSHPGNSPHYTPERFHIPMIWTGGALNISDTTVQAFSSHTDIAPTVLEILQIPNNQYNYGSNIFSPFRNDFVYYVFNNGFGMVDSTSVAVYDLGAESVIIPASDSVKLKLGKSYMQQIYWDFNNK